MKNEAQNKGSFYGYPWKEWFLFAIMTLKISPSDFWQLSIREWQWIIEQYQDQKNHRLTRSEFDVLREIYPD